MAKPIFLARKEEQDKFRQVLRSHQIPWLTKHLPTLSQPFRQKTQDISSPHIFLLHGEGGMGKTSLCRRLQDITKDEFARTVQTMRLDWEEASRNYVDLQVGPDNIRPETVLAVLQKNLEQAFGKYFDGYLKAKRDLDKIADKLDREVRASNGAEKYRSLIGSGLYIATGLLRKLPNADKVIESDEQAQTITDTATAALVSLLQKKLSLAERKLYADPRTRLAEALGEGLAKATATQPIVIFLDTYEIVDRPDCDYGLRQVIKSAGTNVVWVIAGRADLTKSRRSHSQYIPGYEQDFNEHLYSYSLTEFDAELVQTYFEVAVPERALPADGAKRIATFSLGIPFVVQQIAEIWQKAIAIELEEILAQPESHSFQGSDHDKIIGVTSARFLKHCFSENLAGEALDDLRMVCAIALLRQPDDDLLQAMLQVEDFMKAIAGLKERHSFILLAGQGVRLHDKMADFLREALRSRAILRQLRINHELVRELNEYAVIYLEDKLKKLQKNLPIPEWYEDERMTNAMLSLVHHLFGLDEERGWAYAIPRFVEAWQYKLNWAESLLITIKKHQGNLCNKNLKRLKKFQDIFLNTDQKQYIQILLRELKTISQTTQWLDGIGKEERDIILMMKEAWLNILDLKSQEALKICSYAVRNLENKNKILQEKMKSTFSEIAFLSGLHNESNFVSSYSIIQTILKFDESNYELWNKLGILMTKNNKHDLALKSYDQALKINNLDEMAWSNKGASLFHLGEIDLSIECYQNALKIDPFSVLALHNLLHAFISLDQFQEALKICQTILEITPNDQDIWMEKGNILRALDRSEEALFSHRKAIDIAPDFSQAWYNKGTILLDQNKVEEALEAFNKAIEFDEDYYKAWKHKAVALQKLGKYEEIITSYDKILELEPDDYQAWHNRGYALLKSRQINEGLENIQRSIDIKPHYHNYNSQAYAQILMNDIDAAIESIQAALSCEPSEKEEILGDSDFDSIRDDPRFQALIS